MDGSSENFNYVGKVYSLLPTRETYSPPKAEVDEASLQKAMDKNKESLKVKLMTRRPISQLVEQGIIPSLKTPPHFHEQRQKLERAKMGDILKNKIQRRPDRQELIQQHILEDTTVDPSLQDKQRQLKKARLADDLNDRLSHRPGPLELVKGNILQTDEKFAQAVKEGHILFKRTCEGQSLKHPPPRFIIEEDSSSDAALSPPQDTPEQSLSSLISLETATELPQTHRIDSPTIKTEPKLHISHVTSLSSSSSSSQSVGSNSILQSEGNQGRDIGNSIIISSGSSGSSKNRKKSKPKSQPKTRTIKFHEYKGPPNVQKNQAVATSPSSETSYELLLKQQQLFLQWQLEWQNKYPQMILHTSQNPTGDQSSNINNRQPSQSEPSQDASISLHKCLSRLEDMKVSDLKAELKKRNLPVSGSKPQLIERLKPYSDLSSKILANSVPSGITDAMNNSNTAAQTLPLNVGGILLDTCPKIVPQTEDAFSVSSIVAMDTGVNNNSSTINDEPAVVVYNAPTCGTQLVTSRPPSVAPMDVDVSSNQAADAMDCCDSPILVNNNIVQLQQKKIEELQRELQRSQLQLQQQQWLQQQQHQQQTQHAIITTHPMAGTAQIHSQLQQPSHVSVTTMAAGTPQLNNIDTKALLRLQQHLQQKMQQQQILQHLQQQSGQNSGKYIPSSTSAVKASLASFIHNQHNNPNNSINIVNTIAPPIITQPSIVALSTTMVNSAGTQPLVMCHTGTSSILTTNKTCANTLPNGFGHQRTSSLPSFTAIVTKPQPLRTSTEPQFILSRPPPNYDEATKQIKSKEPTKQNCSGAVNNTKEPSRSKKSVKSQAVDDVLEILIKHGELPPSAAQVPNTPTTPENQKAGSQPPTFPTSNLKTTQEASPAISTSQSTSVDAMPTSVLSSLSPVSGGINMTSPPSSVLGESDANVNPALDFDLHLDMIEAMELELINNENNDASSINNQSSPCQIMLHPNCEQTSNESVDLPGTSVDMDTEFYSWLDGIAPGNSIGTVPATSGQTLSHTQPVYSDHDPVLPNLSNMHEPFDLFSFEDTEFKSPTDVAVLSWDKVDFAT